MRGIILYGPPASGKDTVTLALSAANTRCRVFRRLKVGGGKSDTYRMTDAHHLEELRSRGEIAWVNNRYGATYAVDTPELRTALQEGIPVLHLGQIGAIPAVRSAVPESSWLIVELWCNRSLAAERLSRRDQSDVEERLRVWDDTAHLPHFELTIDTGLVNPTEAAQMILSALALLPIQRGSR